MRHGVDCVSVSVSVWLEHSLNHSTGLGARHRSVDCVSISASVRLVHSLHHSTGPGARCHGVDCISTSLCTVEHIGNHSTGPGARCHGVDCISISLCTVEHSLNHSTGPGARHPGVDCVSVSLSVQLEHSLKGGSGLGEDTTSKSLVQQNLELRRKLEEEHASYKRKLQAYQDGQQRQAQLVQKLQAKVGASTRFKWLKLSKEWYWVQLQNPNDWNFQKEWYWVQLQNPNDWNFQKNDTGYNYKIQMIETFRRMILGTSTRSKWLKLSKRTIFIRTKRSMLIFLVIPFIRLQSNT